MKTVQAVYEKGVFRPTEPVDLPENCRVGIDVHVLESAGGKAALDEVYAILSQRFDSGDANVAERHSEHQP